MLLKIKLKYSLTLELACVPSLIKLFRHCSRASAEINAAGSLLLSDSIVVIIRFRVATSSLALHFAKAVLVSRLSGFANNEIFSARAPASLILACLRLFVPKKLCLPALPLNTLNIANMNHA